MSGLFPQVFKDASLFFSHSTPNLATVIPAMDHIDQKLTTDALNPRYQSSIQALLMIGRKTLNRYYNLTDNSELYRIAMGINKISTMYVLLIQPTNLSSTSPP
jgi:hypothetical protein